MRWKQELAECNYTIVHQAGQANHVADFLSRPVGEDEGQLDREGEIMLLATRFAKMEFPKDLENRRAILAQHHDHPMAGHPGIKRTVFSVKHHYQGEGMEKFAE